MSDLAKNLLTQYYGFNSGSTDKRFLSIHKSVEDAKKEEEKQVTEQTSLSTNEENVPEDESQNNEDSRKFSEASELYRRSSRVFDNIEDAYASDENSDTLEIDLGENILCDAFENTQLLAVHEESSSINSVTKTKEYDLKDTTGSDLSLSFEDTFLDNTSDISDATFKKSQKSSKISIPMLQVSKKVPVCNETFADFSNTELKEFPNEILNKFSQLKMLYMADNSLTILPAEIFTSLKYLEWLDVRNNQLSSLPSSIESHPCIETLLLQGNKMEELPLELCTLPKLKTLQVMQNPLITPPKDIVVLGCREILEYLRTKWNNAHPEHQVEFKENNVKPKLSMILCYQSPRKGKKKITSCKNMVHNRNVSTTEKRKFYKPSNRYYDEKLNFLMNINYPFKKKSTFLCNSCLKEETDSETNEKQSNSQQKTKHTYSETVNNCWTKMDTHVHNETNDMSSKILQLMDPSPRSLYVRQNVKILKTYAKSLKKECQLKLPINKFQHVPPKIENRFSLVENIEKCGNVRNVEQIFDIITNDAKRFKLYPMRLSNSDWMLSCLENYIGIIK